VLDQLRRIKITSLSSLNMTMTVESLLLELEGPGAAACRSPWPERALMKLRQPLNNRTSDAHDQGQKRAVPRVHAVCP